MKILHTMKKRQAVSPVIATLLLVAIAVVGGALIFAFAQGYFTSSQVSGRPAIEQYKIAGYDASDTGALKLHDGVAMSTGALTNTVGGLKAGDSVTVFVENKSAQKITLTDVMFGGSKYNYQIGTGAIPGILGTNGSFRVISDAGTEFTATTSAAELQPGQSVTLLLQMSADIKDGRDVQLKLTTGNGAVLVGTLIAGQTE